VAVPVAGGGAGEGADAGADAGSTVLIGADDVIVTQTPRAGWAVATDAGETVAIDTSVTPELRREGLAREVIRLIQDARKGDGLDISDRIAVRWSAADAEVAAALAEHATMIAGEVLAVEFGPLAEAAGPWPEAAGPWAREHSPEVREHADPDLGLRFWLTVT
jgi:isoleucyl-tRNA synthetase